MTRFAAALVAVFFCLPASAQVTCVPRADVIDALLEQFSETPESLGLGNNGFVYEVFTSPDGKTWTITFTDPAGTTCLLAAGVQWQPASSLKKGSF